MKKKNKRLELRIAGIAALSILFCSLNAAAEKVVVIPLLGGATGDAVAADVVKGKTFSSKAAGKGVTGTLECHPMGQAFVTPFYFLTFNLLPTGTFTMGSPAGEPGGQSDKQGRGCIWYLNPLNKCNS